jgi:two-component system chemotaxis response regulator CheB
MTKKPGDFRSQSTASRSSGQLRVARPAGSDAGPQPRTAASPRSSGKVPLAQPTGQAQPAAAEPAGREEASPGVELVVVAASTGGPPALSTFLQNLPATLPVPVVIVQHMASDFVEPFAERLAALTPLVVQVARGREMIFGNQVWIAGGGRHLLVERSARTLKLRLGGTKPVNGCCPSADETLRSAVEAVGGGVLAVILTGIGRDGRDGCRLVRQAKGTVFVQDPATATVAEMPSAVTKEGLAHNVLPLDLLAQRVARKVSYARR